MARIFGWGVVAAGCFGYYLLVRRYTFSEQRPNYVLLGVGSFVAFFPGITLGVILIDWGRAREPTGGPFLWVSALLALAAGLGTPFGVWWNRKLSQRWRDNMRPK